MARHIHCTAGHMGQEEILHRIEERFMWNETVKDFQDSV